MESLSIRSFNFFFFTFDEILQNVLHEIHSMFHVYLTIYHLWGSYKLLLTSGEMLIIIKMEDIPSLPKIVVVVVQTKSYSSYMRPLVFLSYWAWRSECMRRGSQCLAVASNLQYCHIVGLNKIKY